VYTVASPIGTSSEQRLVATLHMVTDDPYIFSQPYTIVKNRIRVGDGEGDI
jgi:hypothetical protein